MYLHGYRSTWRPSRRIFSRTLVGGLSSDWSYPRFRCARSSRIIPRTPWGSSRSRIALNVLLILHVGNIFPIKNRGNSRVIMSIRRHLRLLSVLLVGLAGAGLLIVGFGLTPLSGSVLGSMFGLGPKGDFSVSSGSNSVAVPQSSTGTVSITVASLNHLSGDVSITAATTTSANSLVVTISQSSVKLTPGVTVSLSVTVSATTSTTLGYYNVTVQGKANALSHSITILAHVTPPPPPPTPDFYLYTSSSSLTVAAGAYATATVTISSLLSYSGNVVLTVTVYPSTLLLSSYQLQERTLLLWSSMLPVRRLDTIRSALRDLVVR